MNHRHFITSHKPTFPSVQIPGTVDADIGALEREIDEIAADVASMARLPAARDSESDRFGRAKRRGIPARRPMVGRNGNV